MKNRSLIIFLNNCAIADHFALAISGSDMSDLKRSVLEFLNGCKHIISPMMLESDLVVDDRDCDTDQVGQRAQDVFGIGNA